MRWSCSNFDQWVGGENAEPIKKDIETIENKFVSKVEEFVKQDTKVESKEGGDDKVKELEGKVAELEAKIKALEEENANLKKQLEGGEAKPEETA